jgi:hypothetical protein
VPLIGHEQSSKKVRLTVSATARWVVRAADPDIGSPQADVREVKRITIGRAKWPAISSFRQCALDRAKPPF